MLTAEDGKPTILIADDARANRELLADMLEEQGYNLAFAEDRD